MLIKKAEDGADAANELGAISFLLLLRSL